jgi:hypothetical protein
MGKIWKASALLSVAVGAVWAQSSSSKLLNIPLGYWTAPARYMLNSTEASHAALLPGKAGTASAMIAPPIGAAAAGATAPLSFVAITPCRLVDTRTGSGFTGAFGPPGLMSNVERTIPVPTSSCGVPASAAYSLNFTVVPPGPLLFLSAYPTTFQNTSVLNSLNGQIIANGAVIPADANGNFKVLASDPTNLIIDINGYYVPEDLNFLATAATTSNLEIGPVSGTGVNSGTHVAPGAMTTLTANYSIAPVSGCPGCIEQIVVGIVGQANAQGCLYDAVPGGGVTNTGTVTLTAPTTPGIYFIGVRSALQFGCSDALPGNTYGANIASLTVF